MHMDTPGKSTRRTHVKLEQTQKQCPDGHGVHAPPLPVLRAGDEDFHWLAFTIPCLHNFPYIDKHRPSFRDGDRPLKEDRFNV